MQKKIVALAVAGLSTAAFAQTNVTIYGVADVSGQGINQSNVKSQVGTAAGYNGGNVFALQSNSSLIGFKGTEDLGNGLKALFQAETTMNLTGSQHSGSGNSNSAIALGTGNAVFGAMRDSFIGLNSKYGTVLGGYLSTPLRSSLTSFAVEPGATGSMQIDKQMGGMRFGPSGVQFSSAIRATAIAYAMPTLYGFDASIAYTGSNNQGTTNSTSLSTCNATADTSACTAAPQSAWGLNLGWTGYGVNIKGAFQQANNNFNVGPNTGVGLMNQIGDYTSYLVGAQYTGIQNLKLSTVYLRNTLGTNGSTGVAGTATQGLSPNGANKLTNNQLYAGVGYRMGNWEPTVSATWSSDVDGSTVQQLGSRQWQARVGYYMSKRTQVYGLISNLNNSANQNYTFGQQTSALGTAASTTGSNLFTYGMGLRTSF
ncbi:porin [Flavobacterium sp.]|jgi:predicted porin|uniref:porin n=1 Tax=Flavobacterium sp. TaxID=239 RepID=UPI0037BEB6DD